MGMRGKAAVARDPEVQAGGARLGAHSHGDYLHVLGLVLEAQEDAADAVAFTRDLDSDPEREDAVAAALARIHAESCPIEVIGGVAKPAIEGWILALCAVPRTDKMSRDRTLAHLAEHGIGAKSTADYVDVVEQAELGEPGHFGLPPGAESLRAWLATAHEVLTRLVHGRPAP